MSSIRLFLLDSFERHGEMHGHQVRLLAEQEHVHFWTDISVGALYGAIKRLVTEELLTPVRSEREGNFPQRTIHAITPAGRLALEELRAEGLSRIVLPPDPFDLALARLDRDRLDAVAPALERRVTELERLLTETEEQGRRAAPFLSLAESHALGHRETRLRAEIDFHRDLLAALPAIVHDERTRATDPLPKGPSA